MWLLTSQDKVMNLKCQDIFSEQNIRQKKVSRANVRYERIYYMSMDVSLFNSIDRPHAVIATAVEENNRIRVAADKLLLQMKLVGLKFMHFIFATFEYR